MSMDQWLADCRPVSRCRGFCSSGLKRYDGVKLSGCLANPVKTGPSGLPACHWRRPAATILPNSRIDRTGEAGRVVIDRAFQG
jgi:hypothetical protein